MINKDICTLPTDAKSQYSMGVMYEYGQGVTQDYKEAVKWYTKSAEQGNSSGQHHLDGMISQE